MRAGLILVATAMVSACAGSPTERRWSCAPTKGAFRSCASIAEIDARSRPQPAPASEVTLRAITGAAPANLPDARPIHDSAPVREGDRVLRITVAPWIDAAGDYHDRSDIYAVVRRGGWTVPVPPPPPPPVASETRR